MQTKINPLFVIIDPPGIQYGRPGETVEIHVVVRNEGNKSAVIDLSFTFDEIFQKISNWSESPRASLTLAPEEISNEVTFKLEIPIDALPGTYDYTFVVDSFEHYPQDTPISFPGQIKVLLKEQTVIRASDPIFSIQPATNPNKTLVYKPEERLQVKVKVENRSFRVDRFHLTCPELDRNSLRISYPETGVEGAGLLDVSALELNPTSEGLILLEFYPPSNILAGTYSPTIRLHSENNPELILLDLVYINIPIDYTISAELNTILGKVSRKDGKYQLTVVNQGNLVRELSFALIHRDEDKLFKYQLEPKEIKLLPSKSIEADLTVKPQPWWRRPWIGRPLAINFQVDIKDKQDLPITTQMPQGVLEWKSRPIWQIFLLILAGFGLVALLGFLIWKYLYPDPVRIEKFEPTNFKISAESKDQVLLNWKIYNYNRMADFRLIQQNPPSEEPLILNQQDFENKLFSREFFPRDADQNDLEPVCKKNRQVVICTNYKTGQRDPGEYTFKIEASYRRTNIFWDDRKNTVAATTNVTISPPIVAEVGNINTIKGNFKRGDKIPLNWSIKNPQNLEKIEIVVENDRGVSQGGSKIFTKAQIEKQNICDRQGKCTFDEFIARNIGTFVYEVKAYSNSNPDNPSVQKSSKIEVVAQPSQIKSLKLNGRNITEKTNYTLNEGENVTFEWEVKGDEKDVKIEKIPNGIPLPLSGKREIIVAKNLSKIGIRVTDKSGEPPKEQFFDISVNVNEKPPTPNIIVVPFSSTSTLNAD
ncbi:hypothetical protein [Rivularia sp. UHCC 0363]|uniref:COG1470 family protein n=1 Tax=Rivularia sp. UHCC 0363 TaxID=3110244 RepID=UPI002B202217|nr:hypothetical protein [Rivularia sp. UHCC 0363]MEA5598412.1 hypothetical protein [Rivularia sp. UHCC 0363]